MRDPEFLIVGSGLTGATIARILSDAGKDVLVVERRPRVGGNIVDTVHPCGVRYNLYGPHFFRTNSEDIWNFLHRFSDFYPYEAELMSFVDGKYEQWPITGEYVRRHSPMTTTTYMPPPGGPYDFVEACRMKMPEVVYRKRIEGYNEKQWGVMPRTLSPDLAERIRINWDDDSCLFPNHRFQGLPVNGYSALMERMLEGIPVILNCDALESIDPLSYRPTVIYTGSLDKLFDFQYGHLPYRAQERVYTYDPDVDGYLQPAVSVTYPEMKYEFIRVVEWKHQVEQRFAERIGGTLTTEEVPFTPTNPNQYEYPFPSDDARELYMKYKECAEKIPNFVVCGRLGDYRYYDMDSAIQRAMDIAEGLLEE